MKDNRPRMTLPWQTVLCGLALGYGLWYIVWHVASATLDCLCKAGGCL
jgi:hypothetical protein